MPYTDYIWDTNEEGGRSKKDKHRRPYHSIREWDEVEVEEPTIFVDSNSDSTWMV